MNKLKTYILQYICSPDNKEYYYVTCYCVINSKNRREALKYFKNEINGKLHSIDEVKNKPGIQYNNNVSVLQEMS